jgi:septal ring factor EnvC (AmiA/AmiB activator)
VLGDAQQLESLVAELREALSRSETESEALRKERESMAADVSELRGKMEEYGGMVTELEGRVKAAEGELSDTQRHAVKLARALHEEKIKSGRAGHLLAEQRKALGKHGYTNSCRPPRGKRLHTMRELFVLGSVISVRPSPTERCHTEQEEAAARVSELQQRVASAEEATSTTAGHLKAASAGLQAAEERVHEAESRAVGLEREKGSCGNPSCLCMGGGAQKCSHSRVFV